MQQSAGGPETAVLVLVVRSEPETSFSTETIHAQLGVSDGLGWLQTASARKLPFLDNGMLQEG